MNIATKKVGQTDVWMIPMVVTVEEQSFLHIGAAPSPLSEKKGAVFKVDRTPVIPASSFKGALRYQLELLFSAESESLAQLFNLSGHDKDSLKPCIPAPRPSDAERELQKTQYRKTHCQIQVGGGRARSLPGVLCPVCYFMGAAGIMGFVRVPNLFPKAHQGSLVVDQTGIRIDRKTGTAAEGAKVELEQVKPGTQFNGVLEVVLSSPVGMIFGQPRTVAEAVIDPWLEAWQENNTDTRQQVLLDRILVPALQNIQKLGGQKSKGGGNVVVTLDEDE